jgi:hypothetical protein
VTKEYLEAYSAQGYGSQSFRQAKCTCGGEVFELLADDDEGCAKRICTSCGSEHFICDSKEYWPESAPEKWKCVEPCGILGCFAGWKVAYSPSKQLLAHV